MKNNRKRKLDILFSKGETDVSEKKIKNVKRKNVPEPMSIEETKSESESEVESEVESEAPANHVV